MEQLIYFYNDDLTFSHVGVMNGEGLPTNATKTAPSGYEPFSYNPTEDSWKGASKEEWESTHASAEVPNDTDQLKTMVGTLVAENAKKDQSIKQLQTMAGTLVAQVAELQKGSN